VDQHWRAPAAIVALGLVSTVVIAYVAGVANYEHSVIVVVVGALGTTSTVLAALFVRAVTRSRAEAAELVARRTAELQTLIDRAPDPTMVVDRDGTIRSASERAESLLGWARDELIGRSVEDLIPADVRDVHVRHRATYLTGEPAAREMGPDRELTVLHRNGHEIAVEVSLNPLPPGADGQVDQVVVALRDATLRRRARQNLEESISQKTAFLRTVSHELRTPLTAIAGFTDLLETSWDTFDDATRREFLRRIGRNAVGLHALIEEILAFSRLERGKVTVDPGPMDLAATVRSVVQQLDPVLGSHHVVVDTPEHVSVFSDDQTVGRILTNVLVNAARYSPVGTTITVTVTAEDPALVTIDDQGPGIPEDERRLVFEQFWRGNHSHVIRQTGTGIGLAVVAQLTRLLGGDVRAAEAPGGGARIELALPVRSSGAIPAVGDREPTS
jgi:PAS domain S-box-containing protein